MRVGENTTLNTVRDSLNRSRVRMNELQKQNSTLKRVNAPSDDPVGNTKLMTIRNETLDNEQFEKNANLAKTFLNYTDSSLEEVTNLVARAKELALGQASSAANGAESRAMVAQEIKNIQSELTGIANRAKFREHLEELLALGSAATSTTLTMVKRSIAKPHCWAVSNTSSTRAPAAPAPGPARAQTLEPHQHLH